MKKKSSKIFLSILLSFSLFFIYSFPLDSMAISDVSNVEKSDYVEPNTDNSAIALQNKSSLKVESSEIENDISPAPTSITATAVLGTVAAAITIMGASYAAGHYAAKQCHVRLGLSKKSYKSNRWYYRAAIASTFGFIVALGFDDYFYGV